MGYVGNEKNDKNINCCINTVKLSIVIPVYNVEKWIERCLRSIYCQNINEEDFEIIVVDDGTEDKSIEIVESFGSSKSNLKVVHQKNHGLSVARNTGLLNATGEYVWFIDSDDFIEPDKVAQLIEKAKGENLDVLAFELYITHETCDGFSKEKYVIPSRIDDRVVDGLEFITSVGMPPAAWCALYRRQFLIDNDLKFMPGILHEDQEFTPRAYCLAKRISFMNQYVYNYVQRDGSIMKSDDKVAKKSRDLLAVCDSLYAFANRHLDKAHPAYQTILDKVAFAYSQSLKNNVNGAPTVQEYQQKPYYPLIISKKMNKKDIIKYRLINFSLSLYLFLIRRK